MSALALDDLPQIMDGVLSWLKTSREIALAEWGKRMDIIDKDDMTPVTQTDRKIETYLRARIAQEYPGSDILGEEYESIQSGSDWQWILDPIDGTRAFITHVPFFATLIALCHQGRPVLGCADFPALGQTWYATSGHGCRHIKADGTCVEVTSGAREGAAPMTLDQGHSRGGVGTPLPMWEQAPRGAAALHQNVSTWRYSLDSYQYMMVAEGHLELCLDNALKAVDYLAPAVIVEEAGGMMSYIDGSAPTVRDDASVIAARSPQLLEVCREMLDAKTK